MSFVAGAYTVTHDAITVGQLKAGITWQWTAYGEIITGDNFARAAQDIVFQGIDMVVDYELMEWDEAGAEDVYWPWGSAWLSAGVVGRIAVQQSLHKQLVATAIAGTPAATFGPASVTLPRVILHEDFPVQTVYAPQHRRMPVRQRAFPDANGVYGTKT
jgi:hypothetical protein